MNWSMKRHRIDADGHDPTLAAPRGSHRAGGVHLRQHPTTENISGWIGVSGHCPDPKHRSLIKFRDTVFSRIFPSVGHMLLS
jgi:hypothetical protein